MLFSRVKITSLSVEVHLVFHWCFYNKQISSKKLSDAFIVASVCEAAILEHMNFKGKLSRPYPFYFYRTSFPQTKMAARYQFLVLIPKIWFPWVRVATVL